MSEPVFIPASWKRRFLAWYIDIFIIYAIWVWATFLLGLPLNATLLGIPLGILFEIFLVKKFRSIGEYSLGISRKSSRVASQDTPPLAVVDPIIFKRETIFSILIGLAMLTSGAKSIYRWVYEPVPFPIFSFTLKDSSAILFQVLFGLISIVVAALILRTKRLGLMLGIIVSLYACVWAVGTNEEAMKTHLMERKARAASALVSNPRTENPEVMYNLFLISSVALGSATTLGLALHWRRFED